MWLVHDTRTGFSRYRFSEGSMDVVLYDVVSRIAMMHVYYYYDVIFEIPPRGRSEIKFGRIGQKTYIMWPTDYFSSVI